MTKGIEIINAEATTSSENGYVYVRINPVPSKIPTNIHIEKGDVCQIQTYNSRNPVVVGVVGAGDRQQAQIRALTRELKQLKALLNQK